MKTMTCRQLGGVCEKTFSAATFDEIAKLSKAHGTEMYQKKDPAHLEAMGKMRELMHNPEDMQKWMASKEEEFNNLPMD